MPSRVYRVAHPPPRPLVLFDGECRFCRHWAGQWARDFAGALDVEPAQQAGGRFPQIPAREYDVALQLIEPDGFVYSGAVAALRALSHGRRRLGLLLALYEKSRFAAAFLEWGYRRVARNRRLFSLLMR